MTLIELAVTAGDLPEDVEFYLDEIVNNVWCGLTPHIEKGEEFAPIGRRELVMNHYGHPERVYVPRIDVDSYLATRDKEAAAAEEAARYTTYGRLSWNDPDNRDRGDYSHPVFAADGAPAFERFRHADHVKSWLATGGSFTDEAVDAAVLAHLNTLMADGVDVLRG